MNYRKIVSFLGVIMMIIGVSMLLPIFWSLYYGDADWSVFLLSSLITCLLGYLAFKTKIEDEEFHHREALIVVTFSWVLAAVFGALPYLLSGVLTSFADGFFETMSGFTTTGASVFQDVEALPHGILFWRSLTQWLGGMGIVVLLVAILSTIGNSGIQMFWAEAPGAAKDKIRPRISESAKILWYTYLIMTFIETVLLWLLGMPLFDALCHTFSSVATGGFSTKNASLGFYENSAIYWVITIFMFMSGANFALYYQVIRGKSPLIFWKDEEFKFYSLIVFFFGACITVDLILKMGYGSWGVAVQDAFFHVVSIITTTGYAITDYAFWTPFAQGILVVLTFIGSCSGSTSGAIKVGRLMVIIKQMMLEFRKVIHPKAIFHLKIDGKAVPADMVMSILQFFFIYISIAVFGTLFMAFLGLDLVSAFTSVVAALGNVGPGLEKVGPMANYSFLPDAGKYLLSFLMMLGRLELYTVIVLLIPAFWRYRN